MKHLAAALLGTSLLAAPAFAGGLAQPVTEPTVAPPAPAVAPVAADGDWGGAYAGVQLGYANGSADSVDGKGAVGGVFGGYRWDLGKAVLGVEADANAANVDFDGGLGKAKSLYHLKLQAGYDLGKTLVYVTAGAAHASADIGGDTYSDTGYFGGLGLDYAVNDRWTVGGEVLAHRFDNFDSTGVDAHATTVALRASMKF